MARIFIDTDELRTVAGDLRRDTGEIGPLLGRLGSGFQGTWMPLQSAPMGARWEGQNMQLRALAVRVHNDANSLTAEALWIDALEAGAYAVGQFTRGVRWTLTTVMTGAAWIGSGVIGALHALGNFGIRALHAVGNFGRQYLLPLGTTLLVAGVTAIAKAAESLLRLSSLQYSLETWARNRPYSVTLDKPPRTAPPSGSSGNWDRFNKAVGQAEGFGDLMERIGELPPGAISIIKTQSDPPHWTVLLRGLDLDAGAEPNTLGGAACSMLVKWCDYEAAVSRLLVEAGVKPGDHVALIGHSQGGITARNLASDRTFNETYKLDLVVTAGSPVETGFPIRNSATSVVGLQNTSDPVTVTNTRDFLDQAASILQPGAYDNFDGTKLGPGINSPFAGHANSPYADRIRYHESGNSSSPVANLLRDPSARRFLPPPGEVQNFGIGDVSGRLW